MGGHNNNDSDAMTVDDRILSSHQAWRKKNDLKLKKKESQYSERTSLRATSSQGFSLKKWVGREKTLTFVKPLFIERYKSQTSYRTCIEYVLEKPAFSSLLIFYFISGEVGRRTQPSSIHLLDLGLGSI